MSNLLYSQAAIQSGSDMILFYFTNIVNLWYMFTMLTIYATLLPRLTKNVLSSHRQYISASAQNTYQQVHVKFIRTCTLTVINCICKQC